MSKTQKSSVLANKEAFISCIGRAEKAEAQTQHLIISVADFQRRLTAV